ncbi:MAG: LamG domain-containing protein [Lentisphaeria bacterium]|nr:LamG domain-containing protein [Lentisphaeria bacterium]
MMKRAVILTAAVTMCLAAFATGFTRSDEVQSFRTGDRKRVAGEAIFFPEFQFMYGLFQNYLHKWIDRPLFIDRTTRYADGTFAYVTEKSFLREAQIVKSYGFNGLGSLANIAAGALYRDTDKFAVQNGTLPVKEVVQYGFDNNYKNLKTILEIASKSPFTARVNNKILVPTYNLFYSNIKNIKPMLDQARKDFPDGFYLMAQMDIAPKDVKAFLKNGKTDEETKERYRQEIRNILTVFDGIQINPAINYTEPMGSYMSCFDTTFYSKVILPMLKEEFSRKEFQDKLLGNSIMHGYINHMSGVNHGEFGTAKLRHSLAAAAAGNPDYLLFFEWNEVNENTCFQPTLYNSLSLQRLISYALGEMSGKPRSPNPGDDLNIPDLIFSYRETLKTGEILQLELLNIPDGKFSGQYTVSAALRDIDGKLIRQFPEESFDPAQFRAVTYDIPTESLSTHQIILPELTVTHQGKTRKFTGFHYIHLRPTVCTVYKSLRQPLRDMLIPEKFSLNATATADGRYKLEAGFTANEKLASLEILDNEREVAAADKFNEFDRSKVAVFSGSFSMQGAKFMPVNFSVKNSKQWHLRPWHAPNVNFAYNIRRNGDSAGANSLIWCQPCNFILTLPHSEVADAELEVTVNGRKSTFKLADLQKLKKMAALVIPEERVRLDMEFFEKLPDHPYHPDSKTASISETLRSDFRFPVYQLRAVSKSGKIFRSKPLLPKRPEKKYITVNLFSETDRKVVAAPLPAALIPDLTYRFDSRHGVMMQSNGDARFDAQLGGGFVYCEPFCSAVPYPKGKTSAPRWEKDNDGEYLHFNGENQYINFPAEVFPRGSFTLSMQLRPADTGKPMVLFRHFDRWLGSASAYLKYDRLYFAFGDRELKTHSFATNLTVEPGKWNKLTISYDCRNIRFTVNGKSRSFPLSARALYFKPFIFGGHDKIEFGIDRKMSYYHGDLREFTIKHF